MVEDNVSIGNTTPIGKTSVFLAWSGPVSQKMAGLLKDYLPLFVRNIDIFVSEDITKGKRWHSEIASALDSTKFGILCLTPENLSSEWIHFEAGALSKTIDESTHVCPLLLDVKKSELQEPLASFHATLFDEKEFKELVNDLAKACGDSLEEGQVTTLMEALWPKINGYINDLKVELAEARQKSGEPEATKPKIDPLLEEVVVRLREQGHLLAMLADQGGVDLGKEIIEAVHSIKSGQHHIMNMLGVNDRHRMLRDQGEKDSVRGDIRFTDRMAELKSILRSLPRKYKTVNDPDTVFSVLISTDRLSRRMVEAFGGRADTIKSIGYLMNRNAHRLTEEDESAIGG